MVCALAAETKEAEYPAMVERHKAGKPGNRGVDVMGQMFSELVNAMSEQCGMLLGSIKGQEASQGVCSKPLRNECQRIKCCEQQINSRKGVVFQVTPHGIRNAKQVVMSNGESKQHFFTCPLRQLLRLNKFPEHESHVASHKFSSVNCLCKSPIPGDNRNSRINSTGKDDSVSVGMGL